MLTIYRLVAAGSTTDEGNVPLIAFDPAMINQVHEVRLSIDDGGFATQIYRLSSNNLMTTLIIAMRRGTGTRTAIDALLAVDPVAVLADTTLYESYAHSPDGVALGTVLPPVLCSLIYPKPEPFYTVLSHDRTAPLGF